MIVYNALLMFLPPLPLPLSSTRAIKIAFSRFIKSRFLTIPQCWQDEIICELNVYSYVNRLYATSIHPYTWDPIQLKYTVE